MLTAPDFTKKQIVFVLFHEGEKMAFTNDNLVVKTAEGKIKFQITCYRLFIIFAVGHWSITSVVIQKAKKFGFFIALMTPGYRLYGLIGAEKDGNTMLKKKQYHYEGLDLAKHITDNKLANQQLLLMGMRNKAESTRQAITAITQYREQLKTAATLNELMAYEGLAAKQYFKNYFNNIDWQGRQPRIKRDMTNATLDIGYTLLFAFIEALLCSYGFDTYCGVMHRQFYMRKSLVCDLVEPFRVIIDHSVKKAINLRQIQEKDFTVVQNQYRLNWDKSSSYVQFLMMPIIEEKDEIFLYVQNYYRAFMKELPAEAYPVWNWEDL